jgi:Transcriptional regulator
MNRLPMDWDLCKTFVAVAETRSFAAAARQLRSSHPTVGRKIAELEGQLGIRCSPAPTTACR